MNKFISAITDLDLRSVIEMLESQPKWRTWSQPDGKNALHFLCGAPTGGNASGNEGAPSKAARADANADTSLKILKLLLKHGLDINSIHRIPEKNCDFPATPLWYAYTRGRNEKLYTWLLRNGADPNNCMFAIAWYNDVKAARIFKKHGANTTDNDGKDTPFLSAIAWKRFDMARWFLENGADPNATDPGGRTALLYTVKKKYDPEYIKLLLGTAPIPILQTIPARRRVNSLPLTATKRSFASLTPLLNYQRSHQHTEETLCRPPPEHFSRRF